MKIFITGRSGFLGGNLYPYFRSLGLNVIAPSSAECNLLIPSSLTRYNLLKFDYIFHRAVWNQAGDFCLHHPGEQWLLNQKINANVS